MEEGLFQKPVIISAFNDGFLEARLHTDHKDDELAEEFRVLQRKIARTAALPTFLIVDPETEKVVQIEIDGKLQDVRHVGLANEQEFLAFLARGREKK